MLVHLALLRHDREALEAVRPERLSVSNFASGWILLIYVGKVSQSAVISPESPQQVNCILHSLPIQMLKLTHLCTHTHTYKFPLG